MASAISHFVVGAGLALPAMRWTSVTQVLPAWAIPLTGGLSAVAPDLDTVLMRALDVPYDSILGHRGVFHSALFLIVANSMLALILARSSWPAAARITALWCCCAMSHPLMDMLTDGGLGVMLWFPFSQERLFFSWRPIHVSPLGIARFFSHAGYILKSEAPFDLAALAIGLVGWLVSGLHTSARFRAAGR